MLPVALRPSGGYTLKAYRERVYAYELYHQLRSMWPKWSYSLAGEVDKSRHPIIRGAGLDRAKPDLLVHVPGEMERNLLAIEIKAARSNPDSTDRRALGRDLRKLLAFRDHAGYAGAALLVFGESVEQVRRLRCADEALARAKECIDLWHHVAPNSPAKQIGW